MNILKYQAFVLTADLGSFTRAAQALHCTQPAVSHMIRALESEWGIVLLERDRSGVRVTSEGLKLLPFARNVCEARLQLVGEVADLVGGQTGLIRIGTFSSVATHWLPHIIQAFQQDYPQIEYELLLGDYGEIEGWLLDGRVDCGFLRLPVRAGLESVFLEDDRMLAILPAGHARAGDATFPVTAVAGEPFMLLEKESKSDISILLEKHRVTPSVRFTTVDDYAIMAMVETGLGISILPELIMRRVPYRVVSVPLEPVEFRKIAFVMKDSRTVSHAVRKFMQYLGARNPKV